MADRCGILVDAGYVLASVAELLTGETGRHGIEGDLCGLVTALQAKVVADSGMAPLRTYWYDASMSGQPEHDQVTLADLPGVRLRLGRLVRGEQKGVDSRLVRDLIVLARDRAISAIGLVAGDEDLVEGVREAQDSGVRVSVYGVPGINQSLLLRQQADHLCELEEEFWRSHFRAVARVEARPVTSVPAAEARPRRSAPVSPSMVAAFAAAAAANPAAAAALQATKAEEAESGNFAARAREAGAAFARHHLAQAPPFEIDRLLQCTGWQVPGDLDAPLLQFAERLIGYLWERPELKPFVRSGFWDEFRAEAPKLRRTQP